MTWSGWQSKEICHVLVNQFHGYFLSKTPVVGKVSLFSGILNDALIHRKGLKGWQDVTITRDIHTRGTDEESIVPAPRDGSLLLRGWAESPECIPCPWGGERTVSGQASPRFPKRARLSPPHSAGFERPCADNGGHFESSPPIRRIGTAASAEQTTVAIWRETEVNNLKQADDDFHARRFILDRCSSGLKWAFPPLNTIFISRFSKGKASVCPVWARVRESTCRTLCNPF